MVERMDILKKFKELLMGTGTDAGYFDV